MEKSLNNCDCYSVLLLHVCWWLLLIVIHDDLRWLIGWLQVPDTGWLLWWCWWWSTATLIIIHEHPTGKLRKRCSLGYVEQVNSVLTIGDNWVTRLLAPVTIHPAQPLHLQCLSCRLFGLQRRGHQQLQLGKTIGSHRAVARPSVNA